MTICENDHESITKHVKAALVFSVDCVIITEYECRLKIIQKLTFF